MKIQNSLLETNNVSITFGGLLALNQVSLQIARGKIVGLIGPNGAGKTTLLNVLTGFLKAEEGTVIFCAQDITGLSPSSIANRGILRTFQNITLFPELTVFENMLAGFHSKSRSGLIASIFNTSSFREQERSIRAEAVQILEKFHMEKQVDVLSRNLPYGDQRKLGIAVCLAGKPEVLLLDEPATGMNPEETIRLIDIIRELRNSGITILLIEHDMKVVMGISEHVIVLNHGEKIAEGSPQEISQNDQVIDVYLGRGFSFMGSR